MKGSSLVDCFLKLEMSNQRRCVEVVSFVHPSMPGKLKGGRTMNSMPREQLRSLCCGGCLLLHPCASAEHSSESRFCRAL